MMEFDGSNVISVLSFESEALKYLLGNQFKSFFDPIYPLFYKNKYRRIGSDTCFFRNAIDGAISLNQAESIELAIKHICRYQNNFSSSFLFAKNIRTLLQMGINAAPLMSSSVF